MSEDYGSSNIKILRGLEAVRKRPGMYIGDTGEAGLHHLVYEVLDNSIDEVMAGYGSEIIIGINKDNSISITDFGRGIPVDIHPEEGISAATVVLTVLHAGGKFDSDTYKTSGGLHGVGASVVNALSENLTLYICREGALYYQEFSEGVPKADLVKLDRKCTKSGTKITFKPDPTIFKETVTFKKEILLERIKSIIYLNKGLKITLVDEFNGTKEEYVSENGLVDYIQDITTECIIDTIEINGEEDSVKLDLALNYSKGYNTKIISYSNNVITHEGGTHEIGALTALTRAFVEKMRDKNIKDYTKITAEDMKEGLSIIVAVRVIDPELKGQTKGKLNNPEVRTAVYKLVKTYMEKWTEENPKEFMKLVKKFQTACKAREAAKRSRDHIQKDSTTIGLLPSKLAECRTKDRMSAELFLVEGDSAGGSAKQARARMNQAVMPLQGKILNVFKNALEKVYKHEEVGALITALGCGVGKNVDISKVRYGKIIIMADADVDGGHIVFLLILAFYKLWRPLIEGGFVYVSVPPLYRIAKGGESHYFNSEKEMNDFLKSIYKGKKPRGISDSDFEDLILNGWNKTRFKGLGEMNPDQLKETSMNEETRKLVQLKSTGLDNFFGSKEKDIDMVLEVLGGKNVEFRRWFLMKFVGEL